MADYTLEFYKDKSGGFRWRRTASNGEIVGASSESYSSKQNAEANANRDTSGDKWEFYKDKAGQHRWRCFSKDNGRQVGKATESFASPSGCKNNARINGYKG